MTCIESKLAVALSNRLAQDYRTADSQIKVIDNNRVVTLTGFVIANEARAAAAEIALSHPGVLGVINELEIDDPDATAELSVILPLPADMIYHNQ